MRRFAALVQAASVEALAQPLSALVFLIALVTVHLAPVFHYHRFGEAGRLARECGFSALLVFGLVFATSAVMRSIGRELESGTAAVALVRPISRVQFFCGKVAGALVAFALFALAVLCATALSIRTSEIGAQLAEQGEDVHIWGGGLACGLLFTLLAFVVAALANRFRRFRFCVTACVLLAVVQPLALAVAALLAPVSPLVTVARLAGPFAALGVAATVFVAFAGALSIRLPLAPATALLAVGVALSLVAPVRFLLPDLAACWLSDLLAAGAFAPAAAVVAPLVSSLPLVAFWLTAGSLLLGSKEIP